MKCGAVLNGFLVNLEKTNYDKIGSYQVDSKLNELTKQKRESMIFIF